MMHSTSVGRLQPMQGAHNFVRQSWAISNYYSIKCFVFMLQSKTDLEVDICEEFQMDRELGP